MDRMKIGKYTQVELPDFKDMEHVESIKWKEKRFLKNMKCVYFLFRTIELLYIGQTKNLYERVYTHLRDEIIFDNIYVVLLQNKIERKLLENIYIDMYQPKYNGYKIPTIEDLEVKKIHEEFKKVKWEKIL